TEIDKQWEAAIARGDAFDKDAAGARKFSSLQDLSFDASGRFILPTQLREIGQLDSHVLFHGIGTTFCLWNPQILLDTTDDVPVDRRLVEHHLKEADQKSGGKQK
ncbi:MAG: division/cell wall cluster transcriptional repressor MraZ, partial [Parasphingorhabdus sp.]